MTKTRGKNPLRKFLNTLHENGVYGMADELDISAEAMYAWCRSGYIPDTRIKALARFVPKDELEEATLACLKGWSQTSVYKRLLEEASMKNRKPRKAPDLTHRSPLNPILGGTDRALEASVPEVSKIDIGTEVAPHEIVSEVTDPGYPVVETLDPGFQQEAHEEAFGTDRELEVSEAGQAEKPEDLGQTEQPVQPGTEIAEPEKAPEIEPEVSEPDTEEPGTEVAQEAPRKLSWEEEYNLARAKARQNIF